MNTGGIWREGAWAMLWADVRDSYVWIALGSRRPYFLRIMEAS